MSQTAVCQNDAPNIPDLLPFTACNNIQINCGNNMRCKSTVDNLCYSLGNFPPPQGLPCGTDKICDGAGQCVDETPTCGNGRVEAGYAMGWLAAGILINLLCSEVCDCGLPDCSGVDPCCDGATCQLKAQLQCSNSEPCCENCMFKAAGTSCRSANGECDLADVCVGTFSFSFLSES